MNPHEISALIKEISCKEVVTPSGTAIPSSTASYGALEELFGNYFTAL